MVPDAIGKLVCMLVLSCVQGFDAMRAARHAQLIGTHGCSLCAVSTVLRKRKVADSGIAADDFGWHERRTFGI
jgi:hypothetical protein